MKKQITLRIDEDILEWFKSGGEGYQTRMNDALRSYMDYEGGKGALNDVDLMVADDPITTTWHPMATGRDLISREAAEPDQFFRPMLKNPKSKKTNGPKSRNNI